MICLMLSLQTARAETIAVAVVDEAGEPVETGSVLICPTDAPCHEFPVAPDGTIALDRSVLETGATYAVLVYDADFSVRYATNSWTYGAAAGTGEPRLRGLPAQQLEVRIPAPPPPADTDESGAATTGPPPVTVPESHDPRWLGGALLPFVLGTHYRTDADALSGVTDVAPGFGLVLCHRWGYPLRRNRSRSSVGFQEVSLGYAQNRYRVEAVQPGGESSDVSFHRLTAAYGLGRLWNRAQATVALAAGYGGVHDGAEVLEFRDRRYAMFGLGLQARYVYRIVGGEGGVAAGLLAQADLMYYFADQGENDHWYGWSSTVAVGVMVFGTGGAP